MLKLYSLLVLVALIDSRSRDPNTANNINNPVADGTIQYKVKGTLVTINNINVGQLTA